MAGDTAKYGLTKFADWSKDELLMPNYVLGQCNEYSNASCGKSSRNYHRYRLHEDSDIPAKFDW